MRWALFVDIVLVLLCSSCQDSERCRAWGGTEGRSAFFQCGDQKERTVECDLKSWKASKTTTCTCSCDGVQGNSFETTDLTCFDKRDTAISVANTQCGWQLTK